MNNLYFAAVFFFFFGFFFFKKDVFCLRQIQVEVVLFLNWNDGLQLAAGFF